MFNMLEMLEEDYSSSVPCATLQSIVLSFLFMASMFSNFMLIRMLFSYKHLKAKMNIFVVALTILNMASTLFEMPHIIVSKFSCK